MTSVLTLYIQQPGRVHSWIILFRRHLSAKYNVNSNSDIEINNNLQVWATCRQKWKQEQWVKTKSIHIARVFVYIMYTEHIQSRKWWSFSEQRVDSIRNSLCKNNIIIVCQVIITEDNPNYFLPGLSDNSKKNLEAMIGDWGTNLFETVICE